MDKADKKKRVIKSGDTYQKQTKHVIFFFFAFGIAQYHFLCGRIAVDQQQLG